MACMLIHPVMPDAAKRSSGMGEPQCPPVEHTDSGFGFAALE